MEKVSSMNDYGGGSFVILYIKYPSLIYVASVKRLYASYQPKYYYES